MGKKRRLNCAKAKFNAKHANHPRNKFLMSLESSLEVSEEPDIVEEQVVEVSTVKVESPSDAHVPPSLRLKKQQQRKLRALQEKDPLLQEKRPQKRK